jgi:hypothetical protein
MEEIGTCAPQMREMVLKRWNLSDFLAKKWYWRGGSVPSKWEKWY